MDEIKNDIQISRLRWLGHVMQMGEKRMSKKNAAHKNEGKTNNRKVDRSNYKVYRNEREKLGRNTRNQEVEE